MDWTKIAWRVAAAAVATGAALALVGAEDASPSALAGAAAILIVAGAIVDRAWAALVPPTAGVALGIFIALNPPEREHHEDGWMLFVLFELVACVAASIALLLGMGVRRAVGAARGDRSPAPPR